MPADAITPGCNQRLTPPPSNITYNVLAGGPASSYPSPNAFPTMDQWNASFVGHSPRRVRAADGRQPVDERRGSDRFERPGDRQRRSVRGKDRHRAIGSGELRRGDLPRGTGSAVSAVGPHACRRRFVLERLALRAVQRQRERVGRGGDENRFVRDARVILEDGNGRGVQGWGWADAGYGTLGAPIYFNLDGSQTIRIQQREDGTRIDQIVLSAGTYFEGAPGAVKSDDVFVPVFGASSASPFATHMYRGAGSYPVVLTLDAGSAGRATDSTAAVIK